MINPVIQPGASAGINLTPSLSSTTDISFSKISEKIESLETTLSQSMTAATDFANGVSKMPTHELMIKMETARLDLMLILQIRNKAVEATQEIYRTQI